MLSEKKSFVGKTEIEFLGMRFTQGSYQPGPHIASELLKFPDQLTIKEIQQFLGIVNYLKEFIPKCSVYTSKLSKMLRKNPPIWSQAQTEAVKHLKQICQNLPPMKLPGNGKRILQTDASDDYWGAVLLEQVDGNERYCGHASGQFKASEQHYHTVYKEILAIKYGIKRFEFHLIGYEFLIRMDNSSFPRIMEFKNKMLPEAQLLRLKDWFSKYQFTVEHIKGDKNLVPDFLSRPPKPTQISLITTKQTLPLIYMMTLRIDPELPDIPPQAPRFNTVQELQLWAKNHIFYYQVKMCQEAGHLLEYCMLYPDYLFLPIFKYRYPSLSTYGYHYHWCLSITSWHAVEIQLSTLLSAMSYTPPRNFNMLKFLYGYWSRPDWLKYLVRLSKSLQHLKNPYIILILHRPYTQATDGSFQPTGYCYLYKSCDEGMSPEEIKELFEYLCEKNGVSSTPWNTFSDDQRQGIESLLDDPYFLETFQNMSLSASTSRQRQPP